MFFSSHTFVSLDNSGRATAGIQLATWASDTKPNSKSDVQSLIFVHENDIYYLKDAAADDENIQVQRLTINGRDGVIFNWVADWLYEGILKKARKWNIFRI